MRSDLNEEITMDDPDALRAQVLARVDAAERHYRLAFMGAVALEGAMLAAFLVAADMSNRTHVLLLIGTVMSYSSIVLGLVALGAHVNRTTLRVLQAIDAVRSRGPA
jgi:hypothetical protein